MPIGPYTDFAALRQHVRGEYGKKLKGKRLNATTAAIAEKIRPGWHKEAAQVRKEKDDER